MSAMQDMAEENLSNSQEVLTSTAQLSDFIFHAFTYIPWAEVLDTEFFADNVLEFGAEEMPAQILSEMTEAGFTAEDVETRIRDLEELLAKTKYSSLGMLLVDELLKVWSEEQMKEWQRKRALNNYRVYHLLQKHADLWINWRYIINTACILAQNKSLSSAAVLKKRSAHTNCSLKS